MRQEVIDCITSLCFKIPLITLEGNTTTVLQKACLMVEKFWSMKTSDKRKRVKCKDKDIWIKFLLLQESVFLKELYIIFYKLWNL